MANPVPAAGNWNGKPPDGCGGNRVVPSGEQQGTWVRLVRRGTVLALGIVEFVKVVDRPNAPFWSNVDNRPAPMRSYTMLAPARITVFGRAFHANERRGAKL